MQTSLIHCSRYWRKLGTVSSFLQKLIDLKCMVFKVFSFYNTRDMYKVGMKSNNFAIHACLKRRKGVTVGDVVVLNKWACFFIDHGVLDTLKCCVVGMCEVANGILMCVTSDLVICLSGSTWKLFLVQSMCRCSVNMTSIASSVIFFFSLLVAILYEIVFNVVLISSAYTFFLWLEAVQ